MRRLGITALAVATMTAGAGLAFEAQQPSEKPGTAWTSEKGEWMPLPDVFPKGGEFKVMRGDPAAGPAEFYFKFPAGYGVPWHFHTPVERVFMDKGTVEFEMRGGQKTSIGEGGYIHFPSRSPHTATCTSSEDCYFYLASNDVFDIHLVDDNWNVTDSWTAGAETH